MGERTPLAALDAPASGRMAVAEAITNLLAAPIELSRVKLSLQLDGRLRRAGRGRRAVRHGARRRHGAVPGAGHQRAGGQGQPVDAHPVERRRPDEAGRGAGVADRHRVREPRGRARHAHARARARGLGADPGRPRPRPEPHGAARCSRRRCSSSATRCPISTIRSCWSRWSTPSTRCARKACCWRTTTAATAACGRPPARWPSPATRA